MGTVRIGKMQFVLDKPFLLCDSSHNARVWLECERQAKQSETSLFIFSSLCNLAVI